MASPPPAAGGPGCAGVQGHRQGSAWPGQASGKATCLRECPKSVSWRRPFHSVPLASLARPWGLNPQSSLLQCSVWPCREACRASPPGIQAPLGPTTAQRLPDFPGQPGACSTRPALARPPGDQPEVAYKAQGRDGESAQRARTTYSPGTSTEPQGQPRDSCLRSWGHAWKVCNPLAIPGATLAQILCYSFGSLLACQQLPLLGPPPPPPPAPSCREGRVQGSRRINCPAPHPPLPSAGPRVRLPLVLGANEHGLHHLSLWGEVFPEKQAF